MLEDRAISGDWEREFVLVAILQLVRVLTLMCSRLGPSSGRVGLLRDQVLACACSRMLGD